MTVTIGSFVLLFSFVGNVLYVQYPPKVHQAFVCFAVNNTKNDTWPSQYRQLQINRINDNYAAFKIVTDNINFTNFKIRYFYPNSTYFDTPWTCGQRSCDINMIGNTCEYNEFLYSIVIVLLCILHLLVTVLFILYCISLKVL